MTRILWIVVDEEVDEEAGPVVVPSVVHEPRRARQEGSGSLAKSTWKSEVPTPKGKLDPKLAH